ncbi:hypothetical protein DEU56DRAFT_689516, partial [Suillus clintonianus]|uniref:uncharacterized protein n=1 Tax=Suillus clintonianus TaxID=1904413 RepID=UPI001B86FE57
IQRTTAINITGAMRTTALDTLEAHTKLMPLQHRLQNLCYQAAIHLAAHPPTHPLYLPTRKAAKCLVKRHQSSLHHLIHATELDIDSVETTVHMRRAPNTVPPYSISIAATREEAITEHDANMSEIKIYADGSGIEEQIGASAVLIRQGCPHNRAELVGLTLAAQLLATERDVTYPIAIFIDNQAALRSGELFSTKPGHYLIDHFRRLISRAK